MSFIKIFTKQDWSVAAGNPADAGKAGLSMGIIIGIIAGIIALLGAIVFLFRRTKSKK